MEHDFEKLGAFYLGREYDAERRRVTNDILLYDAKDLTTHAVCVGMTGSGKTGLCVGLLEEAAIDGVPAIVIDPKGDLSNLMLTFEQLNQSSFRPWINPDLAAQQGVSPDEYAAQQAELWKNGLADWGQGESRIRKLRQAADVRLYTPGSSAGLQVSILKTFDAPPSEVREDPDLLREQVNSTVTGMLTLIGVESDPIQSREHILLTNILERAWFDGEDFPLERLIRSIQEPPFTRVGVFELESFFPSNDRFQLAMKLNSLIAAPGFKSWIEGESLDINSLLYGTEGKPNIAVFSIAHLSDPERMFFVSTLLNRVLGWMRTQSGTSTLRALLYMDEIFGYMPPVANPPSKPPLMALLKQARAFGLGLVLATQNPADLDYKGLSNAGTWFIGRLQTERDRDRMLDGLAGSGASHGGRFDRPRMDRLLSGLDKRVFLMNNVHEEQPVLFHTRWVMSYLAGPLSREKIKQLTAPLRNAQAALTSSKTADPGASPAMAGHRRDLNTSRPILKPSIAQAFVPVAFGSAEPGDLTYFPSVYASARVHFSDARKGILFEDSFTGLLLLEQNQPLDWSTVISDSLALDDLDSDPHESDVSYAALPPEANRKTTYTSVARGLKEWLYRNKKLSLHHSPQLKLTSQPGESLDAFRVRLRLKAHEYRDKAVDKFRTKYASKIRTAEDRLARANQAVQRETEQMKSSRIDTAVSLGSTILGALLGRKAVSRSTIGRVSTTVSKSGRAFRQAKDVARAKETVQLRQERLEQIQERLSEEIEDVRLTVAQMEDEVHQVSMSPKKKDIEVGPVSLVWTPYWEDDRGNLAAAFKPVAGWQ